jgi:hypothetical protein
MVTYCDCECESCAIHSMLTQGERGCREGRECWSLAGKRKRGRSVVAWAKTRWDVLISVVLSQLPVWIHHPAPSLVCLNHTPDNHGPFCTATKPSLLSPRPHTFHFPSSTQRLPDTTTKHFPFAFEARTHGRTSELPASVQSASWGREGIPVRTQGVLVKKPCR